MNSAGDSPWRNSPIKQMELAFKSARRWIFLCFIFSTVYFIYQYRGSLNRKESLSDLTILGGSPVLNNSPISLQSPVTLLLTTISSSRPPPEAEGNRSQHVPFPPSATLPPWRKYYLDHFHTPPYNCSSTDKHINSSTISRDKLVKELVLSPRAICNCSAMTTQDKILPEGKSVFLDSTCSAEATAAGENQNVISFSLYGRKQEISKTLMGFKARFFDGIALNLKQLKHMYPNWVIRVYTNMSFDDRELCNSVCSDESIYFCDVPKNAQLRQMHPRTWRFATLGDPTVDKFLIRDLDSILTARERFAVGEWELSQFPFHGMRDHPGHEEEILAGMWGGDNTKICYTTAQSMFKKIMKFSRPNSPISNDQNVLKKFMYSQFKAAILFHDSYHCERFKDSLPFPLQRPDTTQYVGERYTRRNKKGAAPLNGKKCPISCRPPNGLHWQLC